MNYGRLLFFFNDTATNEIYTTEDTLSLHDALPISVRRTNAGARPPCSAQPRTRGCSARRSRSEEHTSELQSLSVISYAVFCLKKKKKKIKKMKKTSTNKKQIKKITTIIH